MAFAASGETGPKTVGRIHWTESDAKFRLTPELLRRQIAMYYGALDLIEEFGYDAAGNTVTRTEPEGVQEDRELAAQGRPGQVGAAEPALDP